MKTRYKENLAPYVLDPLETLFVGDKLPLALDCNKAGMVFSRVSVMAGKTEITHCAHYSGFTSPLLLLASREERESIGLTVLTSCLELRLKPESRTRPISPKSEGRDSTLVH